MTLTAPVDPWPAAPVLDRFEPARLALTRGTPMTYQSEPTPRGAVPRIGPSDPQARRPLWPYLLLMVGLAVLCTGVLSALTNAMTPPPPGSVVVTPSPTPFPPSDGPTAGPLGDPARSFGHGR
jgi:hypothetical protein